MNSSEYPTPWQKKSIWAALTTLSVVAIGAVAIGLIWVFSTVMGFLQPILVPFAVAAVLAYLLEPVVAKIVSWGTSRKRAVLAVFAIAIIALTGTLIWLIPAVWSQTAALVERAPASRERLSHIIEDYNDWAHSLEVKWNIHIPQIPKKIDNPLGAVATPPAPAETPEKAEKPDKTEKTGKSEKTEKTAPPGEKATEPAPPAAPSDNPSATTPATPFSSTIDVQSFLQGDWGRSLLPSLFQNSWKFFTKSLGGFLGVLSVLLWIVIVPIYLYYFLIESNNIAESWGDYLPLRASVFKDEVVSTLEEINGYLIAFFRGQLLVSMINGTVTGILLVIFGHSFGILIGLMLCFLGIIPYIGISLCWVLAVLLALAQGGTGTWIPGEPWWLFPLVISAIFFLVQQVDGLFVTPRIVGESVGLHPMTVIVSVFVWGLLLGGLLGAILAVPLTATVKVVLRRYVWERRMRVEENIPMTEETFEVQRAQGAMKLEAPAVK
ncbi:uncharacterized protein DUF20 [Chthoniobacter flavus]|uniref:AI-2E family transporter n=1 Tax=Chthoniobacter flavus TaxID=191863 RepID=UPI001048A7AE|nr:AI-2E family transporter [Chthoniobacter flavus]TCO89919.1 uncharacterized protein DUF20 [Chthoniobacter flavus]